MSSVDVAIPNYQYGRFLRECVESVLSQDVETLRVLVIDNASTDNSVEVAQELALNDRRVEVVARRKNLGPHASFNEGIDWAASEYFMVLCADDLLVPGALARAIEVMSGNPNVHLTYGLPFVIGQDDPLPDREFVNQDAPWRVHSGHAYIERVCRTLRGHCSSTVVMRTAVQKAVGYYRPELTYTDDLELWLRFALVGDVAATDAFQAANRTHVSSQSSSVLTGYDWDRHVGAALDSFFAREGARLPDSRRLHNIARRRIAERAYWGALARKWRGEVESGRDFMEYALGLRPEMAVFPPVSYLLRRPDKLGEVARKCGDAVYGLPKRLVSVVTGDHAH